MFVYIYVKEPPAEVPEVPCVTGFPVRLAGFRKHVAQTDPI